MTPLFLMIEWKEDWEGDFVLQRYLREDKGIEVVDLCSHKKTRVKEKRGGRSLGGRYGRKHIDGAQKNREWCAGKRKQDSSCLCVSLQSSGQVLSLREKTM